ncbi:MAG: LamG domain-containing protein [bacterium]|nr:LamG domain-containing protein [bacterium]
MKKFFLLFPLILSAVYLIPTTASAAVRLQMPPNYLTTNAGLVGWWTFDGKDTNWGTSKTNDISGQGNTGTMTNMSTSTAPAAGKIGQGLAFDGVNDYVSIPDITAIDFDYNVDFSGSVWVKIPSTQINTVTTTNEVLSKWNGQVTGYPYVIRVDNQTNATPGKIIFRRYDLTNNPISISTTSVNDNKWHHVAFTKSGSTLSLYIDGVLEDSDTDTTNTTTTNNSLLYVGMRGATSFPLTGNVDDIRIYSRALSAAEVLNLYNVGKAKANVSPTFLTDGLVGWWTFDGKDTNWATGKTNDMSGSNFNGSFIAMSTTTSPISGKIGQALNNFTTAKYISVSHTTSLNLLPITVSFWVKTTDATAGRHSVFSKYTNPGGYLCHVVSGTMRCWYSKTGSAFWYDGSNGYSAGTVADGRWHHIVMAVGTTNGSTYKDGVVVTNNQAWTNSGAATTNTAALKIGTGDVGSAVTFNGSIDDVRIYNRALSASEITQLYQTGAAKMGVSPSPDSGLVGYWTFDGKDTNWRTNKTNDMSGQGNHGTLVSMSTTTSPAVGKIGQGLKFNGTSQYINTADLAVSPTTARAWGAWVYLEANTAALKVPMAHYSGSNGYNLYVDGSEQVSCGIGTGAHKSGYSSSVPLNAWVHLFCVSDGTNVVTYKNGVQVNSILGGTIADPVNNLYIGNAPDVSTRYWPGRLDDVRIYNYALSAAEVLRLYNSGR